MKFQIDGYLSRERFNDILAYTLKFDIPIISSTYLAERLFDLLDDSGDGRIQEDEYIDGMKKVFASKEVREKLSFIAMMRRKDMDKTYIEFNEIFEFFFNSWMHGFKILGEVLCREKNFDKKGFKEFASKFDEKIKQFLLSEMKEAGINPMERIEFFQIRKWLNKDNTLQIIEGKKGVNIAMSLLCLEDVGLVEKNSQYPSL